MANQIFTPNPNQIKAVAVVDINGRTQTYSSLLSALTAVHQLPQEEMKMIEAIIKRAQKTKEQE